MYDQGTSFWDCLHTFFKDEKDGIKVPNVLVPHLTAGSAGHDAKLDYKALVLADPVMLDLAGQIDFLKTCVAQMITGRVSERVFECLSVAMCTRVYM